MYAALGLVFLRGGFGRINGSKVKYIEVPEEVRDEAHVSIIQSPKGIWIRKD